VHLHCIQPVMLRHSFVVVLVNASHCVNVVMVSETAQTAAMNSTVVRFTLTFLEMSQSMSFFCKSLINIFGELKLFLGP